RRGAARMVGREAAIERILARWAIARDQSRCQTVAIVADAGLGKTRLMQELCSRAEVVDAGLLQGQCHELFASTPLYPFRVFFWGRAGLTDDDTEPERLDKISGYLNEIGQNTPEHRDLVASLLGVVATPQLHKQKHYEFIVSMFGQSARARPLILWVEDAHWLDPSSAELIRDMVAAAA